MAAPTVGAPAAVNGTTATPSHSPAEEDEFYNQMLRLCDAVVTGSHAQFKLSPAAVEQLKATFASLTAPVASAQHPTDRSLANGIAHNAKAATNNAQQSASVTALPGLQAAPPSTVQTPACKVPPSGLNPIFLEKSDSLVRAEGQLKRQRIERDLQEQVDQRKQNARLDRDAGLDAPPIDMEAILVASQARELHVSGLKQLQRAGSSSSFDTNDYYSSQVQSALTGDVEPSAHSSLANYAAPGKQLVGSHDASGSKDVVNTHADQAKAAYEVDEEDDDDEYIPPDVNAFAGQGDDTAMEEGQITPDEDDDDYEPGETAQGLVNPALHHPPPQTLAKSPKVIRNHLTHIAAPQPNRVSPLAVAKGPNLELELVNGRPEIVQPSAHSNHAAGPSRVSTSSPVNGVAGSSKKRRNKKRKRDTEPQPSGGRAKRKRDRHPAAQSPPSPSNQEPRVKDEPISPPPFPSVPEAQSFAPRSDHRPPPIDLVSPREVQYIQEPPASSGLRYEYAQPLSPAVVSVASPTAYRTTQRDNQDLRRVASMHHAQLPPSPAHRTYSPAPQRTVSMTYGDPRLAPQPTEVRYHEAPREGTAYVRERSPRMQAYYDPYNMRAPSPAPREPQRIVIDQYGNRYYAAEHGPAPAPALPPAPSAPSALPRASVAPERRPAAGPQYERAPSHAPMAYAPPTHYDMPDARMPPPPPLARRQGEQAVRYVDGNGYAAHEYSTRPMEGLRYAEAPTSPIYQQPAGQRYMAPPPVPIPREQTSPLYAPPPRSYSVRPEEGVPIPVAYARQASVAPQSYARPEPTPTRSMSVMPGYERAPTYAPQPVQYVDQYGRPIYPSEIRQLPEYRYQ